MEAEKEVRRHCSYLSIMGWLPTCRLIVEEDPWGQHLWKGGGGSRNGQKKMSFYDAGPTTADPTGSSTAGLILQRASPNWGQEDWPFSVPAQTVTLKGPRETEPEY